MSAQNSAGIQTLLDAEREAQKIVQKSREYRTKRVKDARTEAQKEIEEYRKQKDEEFKKFETEHSSGNKKAEEDANKDADSKVEEIKRAGGKSGDKVVEDLLRVVTEVKPEVPDRVAAPPQT
ncbi:H(+)-transporting V1 sector ATPase subunit G [Schaereria dolodes]|nr:H(+)-transporting V1 sector ATPase subunit G [Schaereria dolodes]